MWRHACHRAEADPGNSIRCLAALVAPALRPPQLRGLIFQCPITGLNVQGLVDDRLIGLKTICVPVDCPICGRPRLIDPKTGKVPDPDKRSAD
jgi:hypothetical protein